MIFVGEAAFSQRIPMDSVPSIYHSNINNQRFTKHFLNFPLVKNGGKYFITSPQKAFEVPRNAPVEAISPIISNNFYTQNFGFFCKKELQFEKATKIPFKFRLGSVQQCDWMEGKPNTGYSK